MKTRIMKIVLAACVSACATACYIGRATFEGENMHLYPAWHTTQISDSASAEQETSNAAGAVMEK